MNKKIAAIITARGGSKGIPRKNLALLGGKPLLAYSIEAALCAESIETCYVTTDDKQIAELAESMGTEVIIRPEELATDDASSADAVLHALDRMAAQGCRPDIFALLQPTSPLRNGKHIDEAYRLIVEKKARSVISMCEPGEHPYKTIIVDEDSTLSPLHNWESLEVPRQLLPRVLHPNGAIYLAQTEMFVRDKTFFLHPIVPYLMESDDSIDIDNSTDLQLAELILKSRESEK